MYRNVWTMINLLGSLEWFIVLLVMDKSGDSHGLTLTQLNYFNRNYFKDII